jgi:hypothetical protein
MSTIYQPPSIPQPQPLYPSGQQNDAKIGKKIKIAFWLAIAFVVLNTPVAYKATSAILFTFMNKPFEILSEMGCPTTQGIVLHTIVFFIVAFVLISSNI